MKKFSIIIPVYNNWAYTNACLKSIYTQTGYPAEDFEVLIVDDDSEDGTSLKISEYIERYPNLRYHPNERNLGFSGTCNHGAAKAEGEYLIFLNNDTMVTPDWDINLVRTIEKDRDIWIVGVKCIYPDETIQHAGVAFPEFFENHIGHIFKEAPRYFPLVLFEREFQCVTAACFIIRKEDFIGLNGFDLEYRNGFEDVDLCMRVKSMGKKIIYQPSCEIIHFESRSEGRLDSMGHNKKILLRRWKNFIKPDEFEHFRDTLKLSIDSGFLKPLHAFQTDGFRKGMTLYGNFKHSDKEGIRFIPTMQANKIIIRKPDSIQNDFLLVTGELMSKSSGVLMLKYLTHQEEFYSDSKSFSFRIFTGKNIFYFAVFAKYIQQEMLLEFCNFSGNCELRDLDLYSFNNGTPQEEPHIALVCRISRNPGYFRTISGLLESEFLSQHKVELLITYDEGLASGDDILPSSGDKHSIVIKPCRYNHLADVMNEFISGSSAKYVAVFTDGVHLTAGRIERLMELMESNPSLSIIHPAIDGLISQEQPGILDYSAAHVFSLKGMSDIPIFFRKTCWEEVGGYDTSIPYYFNMDLCFTILGTHNWRSQSLEGIRSQSYRDTLPIPSRLKPEIEIIRKDFYKKHTNFLLEITVRAGQYNILRLKATQLWGRKSKRNPHATLLGSIGIHVRHFLKKNFPGIF